MATSDCSRSESSDNSETRTPGCSARRPIRRWIGTCCRKALRKDLATLRRRDIARWMSTDIRNWSPGGQFYVSPDTRSRSASRTSSPMGSSQSRKPRAAARNARTRLTGWTAGFRIRSTSNLPSIARSRDLKGRTSRGTSGLAPSRIRFGQVRREAAPREADPSVRRQDLVGPEPQAAGGVASHLPRGSAAR